MTKLQESLSRTASWVIPWGVPFAGIGLNVNQVNFLSGAPNPVSLRQVTGRELDLAAVTGDLLAALDRRYAMVTGGEAVP
jgi:BirA family biotin operon repressor/biotin-[acetyl-CoA-carboxylase] ligase